MAGVGESVRKREVLYSCMKTKILTRISTILRMVLEYDRLYGKAQGSN